MTAGILHNLGVDLGNLRASDPLNPKGYFEDKDMLLLHDDMLRYHGEDMHGFNIPKHIDIQGLEDEFGPRILQILQNKRNQSESKMWGWKAPGTGLFMELFIKYLDAPKIIVVFRNPLGMAKSSYTYTIAKSALYDEIDIFNAVELNLAYYIKIITFIKNHQEIDLLLLSYEDILNQKNINIERIANFLSIKIQKEQKIQLEKYIGKDSKIELLTKTFKSIFS